MAYSEYVSFIESLDIAYHVMVYLKSEFSYRKYVSKRYPVCFTPIPF